MDIIRQIDRHVLIAVAISWALTMILGSVFWALSDHLSDSWFAISEFWIVVAGSFVFALLSILILQWLSKFVPMTGLVGLIVFIIAIVLERFLAIKMVKFQLGIAFLLFFNFSWLMLLGLNTWLAQEE